MDIFFPYFWHKVHQIFRRSLKKFSLFTVCSQHKVIIFLTVCIIYSYSYIMFVRYNTDQCNKGHRLSLKSSWFLRPASNSCGSESWENKNIFHLTVAYKHPFSLIWVFLMTTLASLATKVNFWRKSLHDFFHQGDRLLLSFSTVFPVFTDSTFQCIFSKRRFCPCSANVWFWKFSTVKRLLTAVETKLFHIKLNCIFSFNVFLQKWWTSFSLQDLARLMSLHWLTGRFHAIPADEMLQ